MKDECTFACDFEVERRERGKGGLACTCTSSRYFGCPIDTFSKQTMMWATKEKDQTRHTPRELRLLDCFCFCLCLCGKGVGGSRIRGNGNSGSGALLVLVTPASAFRPLRFPDRMLCLCSRPGFDLQLLVPIQSLPATSKSLLPTRLRLFLSCCV